MHTSSIRLRLAFLSACLTMIACGGGSDGTPGAEGLSARIVVSAEPTGPNCAIGGSKITAGLDSDGNGVLAPIEVSSTQYVCNGAAAAAGAAGLSGASGPSGGNGHDALVAMVAEAAGAHCASGGQRIDAGLDGNGNRVLDAAEVTSSSYVCNGSPGGSASNGKTSLVSIVAEPAGANCSYGGSVSDYKPADYFFKGRTF